MNYNNKVVTSIVVNETVKLDIGYTCTNRADLNQKKKKYILKLTCGSGSYVTS